MTPNQAQLAQARVLVVGDVMLDRYWYGAVDRISPEAPVPVVRVAREENRLGGCANVAYNITSLGAQASLLSVVGEDEASHELERLLHDTGITPCLGRDAQLVEERVVPDLLHVVPVGDDAVLDRVAQREDAALGLRLVAHVAVLLAHADHDALVARAADDRREDGARRVVAGKARLFFCFSFRCWCRW